MKRRDKTHKWFPKYKGICHDTNQSGKNELKNKRQS